MRRLLQATTPTTRHRWWSGQPPPTTGRDHPRLTDRLARLPHSISTGECGPTSWRRSTVPGHHRTTAMPSLLGRRQRRRTDFTPTDVVAEHPMGGSSPHRPSIHPMADHTKIPEQHLAPPQPSCSPSTTTIPYQGLGDTSSPPRRTTIPLPDDTGSHRPRQTTSQDHQCRWVHLAEVGRAPQTICPLAISTTIPYTPPRRSMATHHTNTTRTAHGLSRSLHTTHRDTSHGPLQEHDARKYLASTNSDLDALPTGLRPEHSCATSSPIHQPPEDDRIVESLRSTVGTTTTRSRPPLHATNGLDPTLTLGKTTSPK